MVFLFPCCNNFKKKKKSNILTQTIFTAKICEDNHWKCFGFLQKKILLKNKFYNQNTIEEFSKMYYIKYESNNQKCILLIKIKQKIWYS